MDEVKFDFSELTKIGVKLKRFQELLHKHPLAYEIAANARNIIEKRTKKALDVNLQPFPSYSTYPYYRIRSLRPVGKGGRRKTKKGRPMKTIFYEGGYSEFSGATKRTGTTVTLHAAGDMFRSFQANAIRSDLAHIAFTRTKEMTKALELTHQKGKFVGINRQEKNILEKFAGKRVLKLLKDMGLR